MKKIFIVLTFLSLFLTGCGNLSPRHDQKIDNSDGKIEEMKSNQSGIMSEINALKQRADIQDSKLDKIQQGMFNWQSNHENTGVQILSGSGGLIFGIIGVLIVGVIALHYRSVAKMQEQTANILAQSISQLNDETLNNAVYQKAINTAVEENVLKVMRNVNS